MYNRFYNRFSFLLKTSMLNIPILINLLISKTGIVVLLKLSNQLHFSVSQLENVEGGRRISIEFDPRRVQ